MSELYRRTIRLKWNPKPYQLRSIQLLLSQGSAGLLLDPGLGKTSVCLAAIKILKAKGLIPGGVLVVAPLRPCYSVWPAEIEKWDDFNELTYAVIHGNDKAEALALDADIHIINPEGLKWLFDPKAKRWRNWTVLCVDESTKFKHSNTARFKLMRHRFPTFKRRWILTGTIVPNGIMDLFGQIFILDLGRALGRYVTHFRTRFFRTEAWDPYTYIPLPGSWEEIVEAVDPLVLRLASKDYLQMPPCPPIDPILIDLPPAAREKYKDLEDEFITQVEEGTIIAANSAVAGGKCRQICNGALYINAEHDWVGIHDAKIDALEDLLEELQGAPTLVMYEFNHDRYRLLSRFGTSTPVLGGGVSATQADQHIRDFNAGKIPIMFCHPASMAHGLNLQETCHHIIWFGLTWNLEYYDQAIARIYRQGQKNPVFVYHILARDTLDFRVMNVLRDKGELQTAFFRSLSK